LPIFDVNLYLKMICTLTIPLEQEKLTPLTREVISLRDSISACLENKGFKIFSCSVGFGNIQIEFLNIQFVNDISKIKSIVKSFGFSAYKLELA
jgi:hypothetical protein